jgi:uncharacterized membrane protein YvbJ
MLEMHIITFCKKCGKQKNKHEIGNGKPCKYCGGDIISQSKCNYEAILKNITQQPLSGSPEGSPKSATPTSDNVERYPQ